MLTRLTVRVAAAFLKLCCCCFVSCFGLFLSGLFSLPVCSLELQIHWLSIINSFVLVVILTLFLGIILLRVIKNDFTRYMDGDEVRTLHWRRENNRSAVDEHTGSFASDTYITPGRYVCTWWPF